MDQTKRPFVIPPDFGTYAEKHGIFDMNKRLLEHLIISMPNDPITFLINLLKKRADNVPRILVLGPPTSGKYTISKMICERYHCVHLTLNGFVQQTSRELRRKVNDYCDKGVEPPLRLWIKVMTERLKMNDCVKRGWLITGFPQRREMAIEMQMSGILPDHVIFLDAPDESLLERAHAKYIDPKTENVYHAPLVWPTNPTVQRRLLQCEGSSEEVVRRLRTYRRDEELVRAAYHPFLKVITTDQPKEDAFAEVKKFLDAPSRSYAPFTPRVLLLGPPGSGCSTQGALLAEKYNVVHLPCSHILKQAAGREDKVGLVVRQYVLRKLVVPDDVVMTVLKDHLGRLECMVQGWVVTGFPLTLAQALLLGKEGFKPNRVFFLDVVEDVVLDRLCERVTDPVTGRHHHLVNCCPFEARVQERLQRNPRDEREKVYSRLQFYNAHFKELSDYFYPESILVDACQTVDDVFELLEHGIVMPLSNKKLGP